MVAIIGGVIAGAGAIGGAVIGSSGAKSAAKTQAAAANAADQTQLQMFNQSQADLAPFRQVGQSALYSLGDMYGLSPSGSGNTGSGNYDFSQFTNSPDYQFAQEQGMQAVDHQMAASGLMGSGAAIKGAQEFGQGLASQQFSNYYNRLLGLAQIGGNAAAGAGTDAIQSGQNIGNTQMAAGQATASGIVGSSNALSGGLSSAGNSLMTSMLMARMMGSSPSSYLPAGGGIGGGYQV